MKISNKISQLIFRAGLIVFLVQGLFSTSVMAQPFGNEWINFSQSYYRMAIPKTGIYRVTRQELENAGIPVNSFQPQNVQLFFKGEEIPCYIQGESSGIIEFVEFYAEKNDGWFDSGLYKTADQQTNKYYSQINDTSSVFFTWNSSFSNKRYVVSNDQSTSGLAALPFCYNTILTLYTNSYNQDDQSSYYTGAQGFIDNQRITLTTKVSKKIATPNVYSSGKASIEFALGTLSRYRHHIKVSGSGLNIDSLFFGITSINKTTEVSAGSLSAENTITFETINDQNVATDISALNFIKFKYPMLCKLGNTNVKALSLPASTSRSYLKLEEWKEGGTPVVIDYANGVKISPKASGNILELVVPAAPEDRKLFITNTDSVLKPAYIKASPVTPYELKAKKYLVISNPRIWDGAQAYSNYRNALLVNVEELYTQFGYGISKHPLAIRNFLRYIASVWSIKPDYLFLLGKGMVASDFRKNATNYSKCLVPTIGDPGADAQFSSMLYTETYAPEIATGRLAANTNLQATQYLSKVMEFEQNSAADWMKQVLHFGGGNTTAEKTIFKNYLARYESIVEDTMFGAYVSTFIKASSDPLEVTKSDTITRLMNNGVSLITFFGHGNVYGFDQNIDEPSAFRNQGKYPLIIANSCYTGNIHVSTNQSNSEKWVLISDKGAIGFMAMSFQGIDYLLNYYTTEFYQNFAYSNYGRTIGSHMINTGKIFLSRYGTVDRNINTVQQYTLHGDPAIVLNSFAKPDFVLNTNSIQFEPSEITTSADSFTIHVIPKNIGRAGIEPFGLSVNRVFPDGSTFDTMVMLQGLKFIDTIDVRLPVNRSIGKGPNSFTFHIDAMSTVDELSESNNQVSVQTVIRSTELTPLIPYKNAMVPVSDIVLKAASGDVFMNSGSITVELDTNYQFANPEKAELMHEGGIVEWKPSVNFVPNKTYYWRIGKSESVGDMVWNSSAFTYQPTSVGWRQSDFGQQLDNTFSFLNPDKQNRTFDFSISPKMLYCKNVGSASNPQAWLSCFFTIEGDGNGSGCGAYAAIHAVVIDTMYLQAWFSDRGNYGHRNYPFCSSGPLAPVRYFSFSADNAGVSKLKEFIINYVPDGYHLMIYTFIAGNFTKWNEDNRDFFTGMGANVRGITSDYYPYIFYTRKGDLSTVEEVIGADNYEVISLTKELKGSFTFGFMHSELVGPSSNWEQLSWAGHSTENDTNDIYFVKIYGANSAGKTELLRDSVRQGSFNLNFIDAAQFPFLQLQFYTTDKKNMSPAALDFWQVNYTPVSDLALNPGKGLYSSADTLQEGASGYLSIAIENIGTSDYDSIPVNYWLQDAQNKIIPLKSKKLPPLKSGDFYRDTITFSTLYLPGNNSIWMEINDQSTNERALSNEQYSFNNIAQKTFFVQRDQENPYLDVTFDGIHIMDGDLVAPSPEIIIRLKDENPYIVLNDTANFSLYLKSQQTGIEEKIAINGNTKVQFVAASLPENRSSLIFSPEFTANGIYELRVQAKDASGNASGQIDYVISFEIIRESSITNIFNYPNPFSTSTRFVFELTGQQIPDEMRIDIFTVSGKLVKVIYLDELGILRVGKNITDYAWDGTDMYGDRLANGVYFYKVTTKINGQTIKERDTGTNRFFKNGFGKMYLIR